MCVDLGERMERDEVFSRFFRIRIWVKANVFQVAPVKPRVCLAEPLRPPLCFQPAYCRDYYPVEVHCRLLRLPEPAGSRPVIRFRRSRHLQTEVKNSATLYNDKN